MNMKVRNQAPSTGEWTNIGDIAVYVTWEYEEAEEGFEEEFHIQTIEIETPTGKVDISEIICDSFKYQITDGLKGRNIGSGDY